MNQPGNTVSSPSKAEQNATKYYVYQVIGHTVSAIASVVSCGLYAANHRFGMAAFSGALAMFNLLNIALAYRAKQLTLKALRKSKLSMLDGEMDAG